MDWGVFFSIDGGSFVLAPAKTLNLGIVVKMLSAFWVKVSMQGYWGTCSPTEYSIHYLIDKMGKMPRPELKYGKD